MSPFWSHLLRSFLYNFHLLEIPDRMLLMGNRLWGFEGLTGFKHCGERFTSITDIQANLVSTQLEQNRAIHPRRRNVYLVQLEIPAILSA